MNGLTLGENVELAVSPTGLSHSGDESTIVVVNLGRVNGKGLSKWGCVTSIIGYISSFEPSNESIYRIDIWVVESGDAWQMAGRCNR